MKRKARGGWFATILFTIISIFYVAPLFIVLINSFKEALIKAGKSQANRQR